MESERRAPVKILKPGPKPNPDQPKIFSCLRCGCEFEADVGEYTTAFQYHTVSFYSACPNCKNMVCEDFSCADPELFQAYMPGI